jgi:alkanesulfonate monooxygenase SsuD/methylene tetrahydromethanopterin reductase-like flavin-dependent oxidoreductase (luciferase family)
VKFGLNVVPVHPDQLGEIAMRAEDLGYESVWVGEHVVTPVTLAHAYPGISGRPPFAPDSRFIEPFTALAYLAALTRTVRYGGQDPPEKLAAAVAELHRLRQRSGTADRPFEITALLGWGQGFDPDLVGRYRAAGVDRLVATPWKRSREAAAAIDQFARDARLETDLTTGEGPR